MRTPSVDAGAIPPNGQEPFDSPLPSFGTSRAHAVPSVGPAWGRCIRVVTAVLNLQDDTPTLAVCSRAIGISRGTIKTWCAAAGVKPKDLLDLARILRALSTNSVGQWNPYEVLNVVDSRTLRRLVDRAGVDFSNRQVAPARFLLTQQLVPESRLISGLLEQLWSGDLASQPFLQPK